MKQLTVGDSFNGFLNSLKVRKDIKIMSDEELYNYIFEVFLGDIVAYFSPYTLDRLDAEGIIDKDIYTMSKNLRNELLEMINGPSWNITSVKNSDEWTNIFEGLKKLDALVYKKWTEDEISYLKNMI
ncbi:hypothetical protein AF927_01440 [Listeria monocytogenes]|uniref:hypothetical protein n=1 Tax=Listeria monocytogenes TaxID=1639 RepID=UPI000868BD4F|nr:hypothetical protein [Listeria monocytogenes]EAG6755898.1 hypothetical protein [Listeria monocytogenes]EAG9446841.1 hypothetical protein [Listeria monocytogenes]OEO45249.1 hypothetical protein AJZ73_08740 [Listeria monocytogenes]